MKVILLEPVESLGAAGDVVDVKPGYARNYLIPKALALKATKGAIKKYEVLKRQKISAEEKREEKLKRLAENLEGAACDIPAEIDDEGKLFGTITPQMIAQALKKKGYDVDRKWIKLDYPIESQGAYPVKVVLNKDVECKIRVWVVPKD